MEENWDEFPPATASKPVDENNNTDQEPRKFGFGRTRQSEDTENSDKKPFGRGRSGGFGNSDEKKPFGRRDDNESSERRGFGSRENNGERRSFNRDSSQNGEQKRSFGFNRNNNNDSEGGEKRGFGGGFRRDNNNEDSGERKGFGNRGFNRENNNDEGGEKRGFGGGFRRDNNDGGERKPFRKFGDDNGERKGFGNRGFGNNDGEEKRSTGFNRRENEEGGEKRGFGGGFRRNENSDSGEKKGFGGGFRRNNNDENGGEKRGFGGGFRRDNNDENGGERKGFGNRSFNRDNDGGERRGGFNRDKSSGDGERRPFRRDGEDGEKRGGFGGDRKPFRRDDGESGEKKDSDEPKRERYIPADVEETEDTLFTTLAIGVNFEKQFEIKTTLSGTGNEAVKPLAGFADAGFTELMMNNIKKTKYTVPTVVQKNAIPIILAKRDLMACAQTGSGKTAAFVLPIMKNILEDGIQSSSLMGVQEPQALILSPTRELALQIFHECKKFSHDSMIKTGILYGGVDTGFQLRKLEQGCNILVATPGRLIDVLEKKKISLEKVKYFVLDEADRMLDMGFEKAVREILEKGKVNQKGDRCTFMFSATFPNEIQKLAQDFLHDYLFLAVGEVGGANTDVEQTIYKVTRFDKRAKCTEILDEIGNEKTMIFVEQKKNADVLAFFLIQKGYPTTSIHGDRFQSQREIALSDFKNGKASIIVCTAVAARGLDIEKVNHVINFDLPNSIDEYVHRIGRTGRCGNLGKAISFFDPESEDDRRLARPLVRILTQAQQQVPEWLNSFAEDSVGSAFGGTSATTDLRHKFKSLSVESKPAAQATAADEEESWD